MQRRSIYSLLLTSFILVFAISSVAQDVTISSQTVLRGQSGSLNITLNNPDPVGGFEILFEVTTSLNDAFLSSLNITWNGDFDVLLHRYIDLSGVDNVDPDVVRMAAFVLDDTDGPLAGGSTDIALLDFTANASCGGTVDVNGISMDVGNTCNNASCATVAMTQFISEDGLTATPATLGGTILTIQNAVPTIDPIADVIAHQWGTLYQGQAYAYDADTLYGPEVLTYSLVEDYGWLGINPATGAISGTPLAADMLAACEYLVEVVVEDSCGATASTSYTIYLWNNEPVITCPSDTVIGRMETLVATPSAVDIDNGPAPMAFSLVSFKYLDSGVPVPFGGYSLDPVTGAFTWNTAGITETGPFEVCLSVTDAAAIGCDPAFTNPNNADSCCFVISVVPDVIVIEKTHDTYQGHHEFVSIGMPDSTFTYYPMGGFDFLLQYDASALTLSDVTIGAFLECGPLDGWEYFVYRFGANGNCGAGACPTGIVRIVAIADMNNGANHPDEDCYTNDPGDPTELAVLDFLVSNDRTLECQYVPIRWIWYDCGDNAISSRTGDTLFLSRYIWEFEDDYNDPSASIADPTAPFPSLYGARTECFDSTYYSEYPDSLKPIVYGLIDFVNGGVDIICADSIDAPGDINLNNVPNEIADAVLFSNYFIHGLGVFVINVEGQIAATDVNRDGLTLSVADLVYLIRVVVGDALPYAKVIAPVEVAYHNDNGTLSVNETAIGAAFVVAAGNVVPELRATNMEMLYGFDGENTRILVWSLQGNAFTGEFLTVGSDVISVEMATREGQPASAKLMPTTFELSQNYPNPFNPATTIGFSLETASDYALTIYNVTGQVVAQFNGSANAGNHSINWDATNQASGIYFYKLDTESYSDTKKMVLLK